MAEIAAGVALGDGDDPPHPFAEIARHQPADSSPTSTAITAAKQQGALEDVLEDQLVVEAAPFSIQPPSGNFCSMKPAATDRLVPRRCTLPVR